MKRVLLVVIAFFVMVSVARADEDPLMRLKDDTMLYFTPLKGAVTKVEDATVFMTIDAQYKARPGMRLKVLREGQPFIHPVTKELLGKVESTVGKVEIKQVQDGTYTGVLVDGEAQQGDKVRISETKVKLVFVQDRSIDWYLADEYYRKLKQTGRIEMVDTALETNDTTKVIEEAQRLYADVALLLTAQADENGTLLRQQLFWVSDGSAFVDSRSLIDTAYEKHLKFGAEFFAPQAGESLLMYDLPFYASFVSTGDLDGDGKQDILLSTGNTVRVYAAEVDLKPLWEIKGSAKGDYVWMDTIDLNRNGKDEIIVTAMEGGKTISDTEEAVERVGKSAVVSYIYEFSGSEFKKLWQGNYFVRRVGNHLIAQSYSDTEGFAGDIFFLSWDGDYRVGEKMKLPQGITIYDFVYFKGAQDEKLIFAYDDDGFLNLYNEEGIRTWRSRADTGGFRLEFKKKSTQSYLDKGKWYIKDRLVSRNREVLVMERVPIADMARGIGFKSSRIKNYWWNGFSMEESVLIDDIKGAVLDYATAGDRIIVLTSPLFGLKFKKILQGENPLGTLLFIYLIPGR